MSIYLHNTLKKQKQKFIPQDSKRVSMYVCGPTVYSYAHIGNARPAVVFDVLVRLLRKHFEEVVYVRNLTDVDDKINAAAAKEGVAINVITERYTEIYHQDMAALNVALPDIEPKATEHMAEIIIMIESLIAKGFAYEAEGHVLFDVAKFSDYGELSGRKIEDMLAGARVEVAAFKREAADFVLWKPSTPEQPAWPSPWGEGRPGWHIECSAMIERHLGQSIDIHGGGQDLIFPHHENEIAQSICAHDGAPYCNYWLHNGFVNVNHEKMSKSIGNVLLLKELLESAPGEAVRYALLSTHYRSPLDWTDELLSSSKKSLDRLYRALDELDDVETVEGKAVNAELVAKFEQALCDDMNTPLAMSELHVLAKQSNIETDAERRAELKTALIECSEQLGLLQVKPAEWFGASIDDAAMIDDLLLQRQQARLDKNYARADEIRDQLLAMNIEIIDKAEGTSWRKR
jgi:cysteinyl-tRNA synthetase|tara:strand:- start:87250 stop:88629 length:1380 start_codon:yes stop_codon:yes gene_type:complete